MYETRHTHSVNASCSYEVQKDINCIHINNQWNEWLIRDELVEIKAAFPHSRLLEFCVPG